MFRQSPVVGCLFNGHSSRTEGPVARTSWSRSRRTSRAQTLAELQKMDAMLCRCVGVLLMGTGLRWLAVRRISWLQTTHRSSWQCGARCWVRFSAGRGWAPAPRESVLRAGDRCEHIVCGLFLLGGHGLGGAPLTVTESLSFSNGCSVIQTPPRHNLDDDEGSLCSEPAEPSTSHQSHVSFYRGTPALLTVSRGSVGWSRA